VRAIVAGEGGRWMWVEAIVAAEVGRVRRRVDGSLGVDG